MLTSSGPETKFKRFRYEHMTTKFSCVECAQVELTALILSLSRLGQSCREVFWQTGKAYEVLGKVIVVGGHL